MNVKEAILKRQSVREFQDKPVEADKLQAVLEAGRLSPSAGNKQEWRFVVVQDAVMRRKLGEAAGGQVFVGQAPVSIICCAETDGHVMKVGEKCYPIDIALATAHMMLQAVELGLGTCWVGHVDSDKVKELLVIPKEIVMVGMLTLGYPTKTGAAKNRKAMSEILHKEKW